MRCVRVVAAAGGTQIERVDHKLACSRLSLESRAGERALRVIYREVSEERALQDLRLEALLLLRLARRGVLPRLALLRRRSLVRRHALGARVVLPLRLHRLRSPFMAIDAVHVHRMSVRARIELERPAHVAPFALAQWPAAASRLAGDGGSGGRVPGDPTHHYN